MQNQPDSNGFYGEFGGAFIPEMLIPNIEELKGCYLNILNSPEFAKKFNQLLHDYAGRPSPLFLAERLSSKYGATVWLKREDLNHTGSHKLNNVIGQMLVARQMGRTRVIAETGAGQHGVATATVCALMGMHCVVYMGQTDMERQAPNVARMKMLGAEVRPAMSGNRTLKDATNEAIRDWIANPLDTYYLIGSVVGPHPYPDMVARLQAIISLETRQQLHEKTGGKLPDFVLACVGGGSNAAGSFYHFMNEPSVKLIGAEAAGLGIDTGHTAASIARGVPGILHGSMSYLLQDEDGQIVEPYSISAGLDYPGIGPLHSWLRDKGRAGYIPVTDKQALEAAMELTRLEGIIPALESAHALALLPLLKLKSDDNVVVTISGRGDKDMKAYMEHTGNI